MDMPKLFIFLKLDQGTILESIIIIAGHLLHFEAQFLSSNNKSAIRMLGKKKFYIFRKKRNFNFFKQIDKDWLLSD